MKISELELTSTLEQIEFYIEKDYCLNVDLESYILGDSSQFEDTHTGTREYTVPLEQLLEAKPIDTYAKEYLQGKYNSIQEILEDCKKPVLQKLFEGFGKIYKEKYN